MRVQYTLNSSTVEAVKQRAASLGIHPSRLVEEYVRAGLRSMLSVTLTRQSQEKVLAVSSMDGSKSTSTQNPPEIDESASLDELLELPPR